MKANVKKLVVYALFMAITLLMGLVPFLGYINITGFAAITIMQIPVILASYFLGYKGGIFFGFMFGVTSLINCFSGSADAIAMLILNQGGFSTLFLIVVILFVPRILIGITTRATYDAICRFDRTKALAMGVSAFVGTLTNTIFVLGGLYLFALEPSIEAFGAASANGLFTVLLGVLSSNGLIEAGAAVVICTAVGQALHKAFFIKNPMCRQIEPKKKQK